MSGSMVLVRMASIMRPPDSPSVQRETTSWKPLRGDENAAATDYPVLEPEAAAAFRSRVRSEICAFTRATYPSLQDSDKPEPPADWND